MVRGSSIRSGLNAHDISPTDRHPLGHQSSTSFPQSHESSNETALDRERPPVISSPDRRALYDHQASPNGQPNLQSDQPGYWSDNDPPSHELDFNEFSVFKAILQHPEITYEFAKHLDLTTLISLYSISKEFHIQMNRRFTGMILAQSLGKASESSRVFLFKCYKNLCQRDPAARRNEAKVDDVRSIPSFRWLRFIFYREKAVDEIIACLAAEGHHLPKYTSHAIKKIWFLLDICDNVRRVAVVQNRRIWTNRDLFLATMFFIKLDMRLTDPVNGNGETRMRKMLLAQRSLSTLWKVLKREEMLTQLDMARMFVRWAYVPLPQHRGMSIMGVQPNEIGRGQYTGWGTGTEKILRPDELVMRETIKRKMDLRKKYLDMMIWGHVDRKTYQDIWPTQLLAEEGAEDVGYISDEETESDDNESQELDDLDLFDLPD